MAIDRDVFKKKSNENNGDAQVPLRLRLEEAFYLPSALARIAQYVVENPEKVINQSLTELSDRAQSGQASVVRLCRELGFDGFKAFKLALAADLAIQQQSWAAASEISADPLDQTSDLICQTVVETRLFMNPNTLRTIAVRLAQASRIDLFGAGISGLIGEIIAYRLLRLGLNAHTIRDIYLAREMAGGLGPNTVAIAISQSGVSPETVDFLRVARKANAFTLAITCHPTASVGEAAEEVLQMARLRQPTYGGHILDLPRAIFIAEAIAIAVMKEQSANAGPA